MNILRSKLFAPLALSLSSNAHAQVPASDAAAGAPTELFSAGYLFQVLGSLVLVFVCLFAVVYFLKRFNGVSVGSASALRVIGSASVGQREKVVLIEVGGEQLLIGVAPGSVRTLHVLPEPLVDTSAQESGAPDFAAVLRAANPLGSRS
ncbi:flagellar biosynthetic protein FliO [Congregibacter brevis]|uniref:Flagellar protein n=1 Tax=Congregibacter brevis TaxID=3081201 RepID=A0ABZ0IF31_9GAMM|nr:flagellar biosynthetic protein FliO [Congregibacter sp. IMCC45268]